MKKKLPVIWDTLAKQSLKEIYNYYKPLSVRGAKKVINEILKQTRTLNIFPKKYQFDPLLLAPYRYAVVGNYKIVYTVTATEIRIIDIYDTRQEPSKMQKR